MPNFKAVISITFALLPVLTLFPALAQSPPTGEDREILMCSDDSYIRNENVSQEDADALFMKGLAFEHALDVEQDYKKAIPRDILVPRTIWGKFILKCTWGVKMSISPRHSNG